MDRTAELEQRITKAMDRLKAQAGSAVALQDKLAQLQKRRDGDLAELDALVAELKPLVEED